MNEGYINEVKLKGRCQYEVELKFTNNNKPYCRITLGIQRDYINKETNEYGTDYVSFTLWEQQAEAVAQQAYQGAEMLVEGKLYSRKNATTNYYELQLKIDGVNISKRDVVQVGKKFKATQPSIDVGEDDLPF